MSPFEQLYVRLDTAYCYTSRRRSSCMNEMMWGLRSKQREDSTIFQIEDYNSSYTLKIERADEFVQMRAVERDECG